jgi:hypothetical protein
LYGFFSKTLFWLLKKVFGELCEKDFSRNFLTLRNENVFFLFELCLWPVMLGFLKKVFASSTTIVKQEFSNSAQFFFFSFLTLPAASDAGVWALHVAAGCPRGSHPAQSCGGCRSSWGQESVQRQNS